MKRKCSIVTILIAVLFAVNSLFSLKKENEKYEMLEEVKIKIATIKVEDANRTKDYTDIKTAKDFISLVDTDLVRKELISNVDNLELSIEKDKVLNSYNNLLNSVENNLNINELNDALDDINNIIYRDIREELLVKANNIKTKIEEKNARLSSLSYYDKMKYIDTVKVISSPKNVQVLETLTGKITAFTPYCSDGCEGVTASGKFVGNGDIYEYDSEFGMVHIVAADPSYPFGTIVRIKNLAYFNDDIYAIVLDRGGAIGKGRRALFDLLFATEESANNFGVSSTVECEILRLGY